MSGIKYKYTRDMQNMASIWANPYIICGKLIPAERSKQIQVSLLSSNENASNSK